MYPRSVVTTDDQHRLDLATVYLPQRRNVGYHTAPSDDGQPSRRSIHFHLTLTTDDRERADRLARLQGVSRTEVIARALRLLESMCERR